MSYNYSMKQPHILIVDDDAEIRDLLGQYLQKNAYDVTLAANGKEMFDALAKNSFNLIILDIMMPGEDGHTLCRKLRQDSEVPVIMLTAIGEESDRIIGLELGADDYMSKPFNPRELLARVKAVLRRVVSKKVAPEKSSETGGYYQFAGWRLDLNTRTLVSQDQTEVILTSGEYDLLIAFLENPGKVLSRDRLLDLTKSRTSNPFDRSIDIQISRLRQKIESDSKQPKLIKTVRGGGYIMSVDVETA